jgi:tetratricopeptide (TPR) repeat protein
VVLSDTGSAIPQATQKLDVALEETREKARRRLKRKLSGDLDVIILKALRKEPARRYASVEQLSEDIRRYLEGRPVRARGDSVGYRSFKFVKRNAAGVGAMAALVVLLLGSTIWFGIEVRRDRESVDAARSRELALEPTLVRAYGRLGEYRLAIQAAREFLSAHPEATKEQAELRREIAGDSIKLGDAEPGEGAALYSDALAQFEALAKDAPRGPEQIERQKDIMAAERKVGLAQFGAGNLVGALSSFRRALEIAETLPSSPELRRAVAAGNFEMGEALAANHEPEMATASLRKALDLYGDLAGTPAISSLKDRTPQGFEQALAVMAGNAPPDLRAEINAELARMRK